MKDPGIDGRIMLKWILEMWDRGTDWINLAQDRKGQVAGSCGCGNKPGIS